MILRERSRIILLRDLLPAIERTSSGVVLIEEGSSRGSGWLITDNLVVCPAFVVANAQSTIRCHSFAPVESSIEAELLAEVNRTNEMAPDNTFSTQTASVLLRLKEPLPGRALHFANVAPTALDQVYLLHFAQGRNELAISFGDLVSNEGRTIAYDLDTVAGSSGGPLFDMTGALIGMHVSSPDGSMARANLGISASAILDDVAGSQAWAEIAQHHNLANLQATSDVRSLLESVSAAITSPSAPEELLVAASHWSIHAEDLSEKTREQLRPLVIDPYASEWVLKAGERQRILAGGGSLEALRAARGTDGGEDQRQRVIDRILAGPPYDLDAIAEEELPYWLQAVRWFADVEPALPTPAQISHELESRRIRGRLRAQAGDFFRGRQAELAALAKWFGAEEQTPMVVTGIGGIGKSSLVAKFALDLPDDTLILWLDFDRPDIAPDDAVSLVNALNTQAALQIDISAMPEVSAENWEECAGVLGAAIAQHASQALLALDGFEVAQYSQDYQEIWKVLDVVVTPSPRMRVLISGRAPVKRNDGNAMAFATMELLGLSLPDTEEWLKALGMRKGKTRTELAKLTRGIPLLIVLAAQWQKRGGKLEELPEKLSEAIVEGYLYLRILDRVMDQTLQPLVRDLLVLRWFNAEMLPAIAADSMPEGVDTQELFARLRREMAVVSDPGAEGLIPSSLSPLVTTEEDLLYVRPELRSATLKLLEEETIGRVREIDARAAAWYATQDLTVDRMAAELVYHRLRLGDIAGAEAVWRVEFAPLLAFAVDDLPSEGARTWLHQHTIPAHEPDAELELWERETLDRISSLRRRGGGLLWRYMQDILSEREERSPESSLLIYDAWLLWHYGDLDGARTLLQNAHPASGTVARNRALVGAYLAEQAGDREAADSLLAPYDALEHWMDWRDPYFTALELRSARIHLTIDLEAEMTLLDALKDEQIGFILDSAIGPLLPTADIVFPLLHSHLTPDTMYGEAAYYAQIINIPTRLTELGSFAEKLDSARSAKYPDSAPSDSDQLGPQQKGFSEFSSRFDPHHDLTQDNEKRFWESYAIAEHLAHLGRRRWELASGDLFLADAISEGIRLPNARTIVDSTAMPGTIAVFCGHEGSSFALSFEGTRLSSIIDSWAMHISTSVRRLLTPSRQRTNLAVKILHSMEGLDPACTIIANELERYYSHDLRGDELLTTEYMAFVTEVRRTGWRNFLVHLLTDSPLGKMAEDLIANRNPLK